MMLDIAHTIPDSAESHMVTAVPRGGLRESAGSVLERLRGHRFDAADTVYVEDSRQRFHGAVGLADLLSARPDTPLFELMVREVPTVGPSEDQELVAGLALEREVPAVPVLDGAGRLLGVVPAQALLRILRREHVEDMNRFVGIVRNHEQARTAIEGPTLPRVMQRIPWLLIGLLGSMLATWLMVGFEAALEERIAVAFFVPAIVYLADAIGTQTEAVAVRGLSLSGATLPQLLRGELSAGLFIGAALGVVIFPSVLLAFGDLHLASAVTLAVVVAGGLATSIGLLFPWILDQFGLDPAYGSGPVATILQDLLSLITYFLLVVWLVL